MDKIAKEIFAFLSPDFGKLSKYGFIVSDGVYCKTFDIMDGQFSLSVFVSEKSGKVSSITIDKASEEEYTLHLIEGALGAFVGAVKAEYEKVLRDIAEHCFYTDVFKNELAHAVMDYVGQRYGDKIEYLWERFPNNAIFRRNDNRKWYGLLLSLKPEKLGLVGDEEIVILDLRMQPEKIASIIDNVGFFSAYHMNKMHWITVMLDGSVSLEQIHKLIDDSYVLAKKR